VGRPPIVLDDFRSKRITDAIAAGLSRTAAAAKGGISRALLQEWIKRGREAGDDEADRPFVDFVARVKTAEAEAEELMVTAIRTAGLEPSKWQAAAWWLERARPADWAKREPTQEQEHERSESGAADLDVAKSVVAALESRKVG
jgi:transposase